MVYLVLSVATLKHVSKAGDISINALEMLIVQSFYFAISTYSVIMCF